MAVPTTTDLINIINVGPFNLDYEFFSYLQLPQRRHYPSIEVEKVNPQATDRTRDQDSIHYTFKVNIYEKVLGTENEENPNQEQAEQQIITLLQAATLADHKIIIENKNYDRQRVMEGHPYYIVSSLTVVIRSASAPTISKTGILVFDFTNSSVDNPPAGNYTYTNVFDVQISDGYREISEYVTSNPDGDKLPINFAGGYNGTLICNIPIQKADIGSTGDKVNKLRSLRSNGEKPDVVFIYTDKDDASPTPAAITESGIKVRVDSVNRAYNSKGNVVWRIIAKCVAPSNITSV